MKKDAGLLKTNHKIAELLFGLLKSLSLLLLLVSPKLFAAPSFEAFRYLPDNGKTHFSALSQNHFLPQYEWLTKLTLDYQYNPLTATNVLGTTKIITHLGHATLGGSFGITDKIQVELGVPFFFLEGFQQIGQPTQSTKMGVGDIRLSGKFALLTTENKTLAIAAQPFFLAPSGFGSIYLSHNRVSGGAKLIVDYHLNKNWVLNLNSSAHFKMADSVGDISSSHELLVALGIAYFTKKQNSFFFETHSATPFKNLYKNSKSISMEARTGFNYQIHDYFKLTNAMGAAFFDGIGTPTFRFVTGVTFKYFPRIEEAPPPPPIPLPPPPPPVEKKPTPKKQERPFLPIY